MTSVFLQSKPIDLRLLNVRIYSIRAEGLMVYKNVEKLIISYADETSVKIRLSSRKHPANSGAACRRKLPDIKAFAQIKV